MKAINKSLLISELRKCSENIDNTIEEIERGDIDLTNLCIELVDSLREVAHDIILIQLNKYYAKTKEMDGKSRLRTKHR